VPFTAGRLTTVLNAGVIDLANGGTSTSDRLVYAKVSYTTGIDANSQSALSGRLGFRLIW
jgi:hypothetical protein